MYRPTSSLFCLYLFPPKDLALLSKFFKEIGGLVPVNPRYIASLTVRGQIQRFEGLSYRGGSRGRAPLFLAKSIFTLYTMSEKIFLKLNFDFIVAEIRGVFGSVGCMRVCASV